MTQSVVSAVNYLCFKFVDTTISSWKEAVINMEFNKPKSLNLAGDSAKNFYEFQEEVLENFEETETRTKSAGVQIARLRNLLGRDAVRHYKILTTIKPEEERINVYSEVLTETSTRFFTKMKIICVTLLAIQLAIGASSQGKFEADSYMEELLASTKSFLEEYDGSATLGDIDQPVDVEVCSL
uniref:Uncharacterized protein n=1 Tax=Timema genevievae TaxID=629358 RepID=A0A7R9K7Z1_TIMGE|nr:unnamed protein product [Timema genevievae]